MTEDKTLQFHGAGWRRKDERAGVRVIDTHFHTFPPLGRSAGWDPEVHGRLAQYHLRDRQEFWRKSDGALVEEPLWEFPSDSIDDMPDVAFRPTDHGMGEFALNGVEYLVRVYPPDLKNLEAPAERMVLEMDVAGVDLGVLQSDHTYGVLNEHIGDAMRKFPGRFAGLAQVREWEAGGAVEVERLQRAVVEQGCKGLYFSVETFALNGYVDHLDDPKFSPLWDKVRELDIPIWWYLDARKRDRRTAFMER